MIVALDSGHGATTPGKRSFDGRLRECEFNQSVTSRLKHHLERHGISVLSTSPNPLLDPSLNERCRRANSDKADLFISIHANAAGTDWNTANGWEIYCLQKGGYEYRLAQCIHDESIPFLGVKDRGIKTNSFTVLTGTKMPAVLIEHGFYSNKSECELLLSDAFREKCAIADCKGILKYLNIKWVEEVAKTIDNPDDIIEILDKLGFVENWGEKVRMLEALKTDSAQTPNGYFYALAQRLVNSYLVK